MLLKRQHRKLIKALGVAEKEILRTFVTGNSDCIDLPLDDPVVQELCDKNILSKGLAGTDETWGYKIADWALAYLSKHPKVLIYMKENS